MQIRYLNLINKHYHGGMAAKVVFSLGYGCNQPMLGATLMIDTTVIFCEAAGPAESRFVSICSSSKGAACCHILFA
jgi:hypothetical protein